MRTITIGESSKRFSRIALGTTYFGTTIKRETCFDLLDTFIAHGGTTIDTARVYGQQDYGLPSASEELIGSYLRSRGCRDELAVVTKGAHPAADGRSRITYGDLSLDVHQSLEALGLDRIDLYFLHRDNPAMAVEEIVDIVDEACPSELIARIGVSNWTVARLEAANAYAKRRNLRQFCASQIQWSLAWATSESMGDPTIVCMDDPSLSWYAAHDVAVFAFSSQAKGMFTKAIEQGEEHLNEKIRRRFLNDENRKRIERVRRLSAENSMAVAPLVVSYITSSPFPSVAIVGCSTPAQLEDTLIASDLRLDQDQRRFLVEGAQ